MEQQPIPKGIQSRGIYLLPNLLTTAALFSAFYSIIAAMKGHFDIAAVAVFVAMIADGLDGRVARMTNTQTAFGAQYDSLSDMVAFGVTPALLMYSWSLSHLGKLGWAVAFLYTAATALRLARFNTQAHDEDKEYFQGLSSTASAGVMASTVWLGVSYGMEGYIIAIPAAILTVVIGLLMVSTIRYHSFKKIDWKGKIPFVTIVIFVFIMITVVLDPPDTLFLTFFIYAVSGPVLTLWYRRKMRRRMRNFPRKNKL